MSKLLSYVIAALFAAASVNAFAMSHAGGAKDDKKMEATGATKDAKKKATAKKEEMKKETMKKEEMKKEEKK